MILYISQHRGDENNTLYENATPINSIEDLKAAVSRDHVAAEMKDGHRSSDNFVQSDCIQLDLDNTHSEDPADWKTIDDIAEAFPDVRFYYIQSRNYMKIKTKTTRDGKTTHYEAREKYHCYFPLARSYCDFAEYTRVIMTAAGLFPFFDLNAAKPAQFFFGVEHPEGGEVTGGATLDSYVEEQPPEAVIASVMDFAEKVRSGKYNGDETQKGVAKLFNFFGINPDNSDSANNGLFKNQTDTDAEEQNADFGMKIAEAEQQRSVERFEAFAKQHHIPLGRRYRINTNAHPNAICICVPCPWEDEHSMNGADNEAVVIIDLGGRLSFLCRHSHGVLYGWKDYRAHYEELAAKTAKQNPQEPTVAVYDSKSKSFKPAPEIPKLTPRTAEELEEKDIPPIQWIVTDMLPTGLAVVAAPPKSYKSYFALGLCTKVTKGAEFFGHKTEKNGCLYLDLESSDRRPRDRLRQILGDEKKPNNLYFLTAEDGIRRIGEGFEQQLNGLLDTYSDIRLVVVDVFQLIKPAKKRGMDSYEADYTALGALNYIAKKRDICIILIHHTKKGRDPSDIFNNMSGSTAMAGAMDTIFIISRENRTDNDAILTVSGRDIEPQELAIRWNPKRFYWDFLGTQEDVAWNKLKNDYDNSDTVTTIKHLLDENSGSWKGTAEDIIQYSKFTSFHINETAEQVGRDINRFEELFMLDGIKHTDDRKTRKRNHCFSLS